ncbi:MAG: hypothetical protein ACKVOR_03040 [Flavobacteriales bacterium]
MLQAILINLARILFLILLQSVVVSRILLFDGLVLPWIYIFGLLMLPFSTPRWLVLVISFITGLVMDYFTGPLGLHTTACLTMGFALPLVQRFLAPREGYDSSQRPTVQRMGLAWYITYAGVLTVIHHTWLFFMEVFRFSDFFYQLLHIICSAAATLLLMTIGQYLIFTSKSTEL